MGITTDRNDPGLKNIEPSGMQEKYLVLSDEERAKGFVRPVRTSYKHVGCRPGGKMRELTAEERERYKDFGYAMYEEYGPEKDPVVGKFWTEKELRSGCGAITTMGQALAETYARNPAFYGGTFCRQCGEHFPVGTNGEFVWTDDGSKVGT